MWMFNQAAKLSSLLDGGVEEAQREEQLSPVSGLLVLSISSWVYPKRVLEVRRRPFGGSFVILIPFCRIETGKAAEGIDVSQRRNLGSRARGQALHDGLQLAHVAHR